MWPPQNPTTTTSSRLFSTKTGKGKPKRTGPKPYVPLPSWPSSKPAPAPAPAPAAVPPLPRDLFPNYSATGSTPLPPPSMPRKRFLRRLLPLLAAAATGAYVLLRTQKKEASVTNGEVKMESNAPSSSIEDTVAERTIH
ncbi:WAS/WASL-interacting protein family member 3 [Iris pallida]|uniref:WAS/WASL-interacting protein family member 3 n=1 Tax=Iris pallida TaxID=29817 RepID=A0AAX6HMI5_IRIPA|nr:WAS/WASL-interacting protein family member 3 [Iris pallida]